ncbi:AtpZ/AtpI family protein [Allokutzneria oryzae]|uniref:AtpZ/AtpI family protein n=1 Tax=Allokutzneria oryzae TaxID=1378989 RepID=A0ABV5ZYA9_9PSEU
MSDKTDKDTQSGKADVWSLISTLLAGPALWGGVGYLIDQAVGGKTWMILGLLIGFVASFYIVYVRHGRS